LNFDEKHNIIFLSRFVKEKNPLLALKSVIEYKKLGWEGMFYLVGSGPMESKIKDYISSENVSSFVKLLVNISDIEVTQIMKSSFVLLHTSKREGFGLSMIEAACQGVPTILINFPENTSVDLAITKELVSESSDINELVNKLQEAYVNQRMYYKKLMNWASDIYPTMLGSKSVTQIENIINDNSRFFYDTKVKHGK
jgi:glycosyltransferase involved in cell wall biosynthesis